VLPHEANTTSNKDMGNPGPGVKTRSPREPRPRPPSTCRWALDLPKSELIRLPCVSLLLLEHWRAYSSTSFPLALGAPLALVKRWGGKTFLVTSWRQPSRDLGASAFSCFVMLPPLRVSSFCIQMQQKYKKCNHEKEAFSTLYFTLSCVMSRQCSFFCSMNLLLVIRLILNRNTANYFWRKICTFNFYRVRSIALDIYLIQKVKNHKTI
jgi:hypothetical protein